jgi:enamine deaminase RidA (YjgF/YER057c/UK114 family)
MSGRIEARLKELGIELPAANAPIANYVPFTVSGSLVVVSGQVSVRNVCLSFGGAAVDGSVVYLVKRVMRLGGFVNCTPEFTDMPQVVNGASDLMVEVFGDAGKHARAAVGVGSLPLGVAVEVEAMLELA